MKSSACPADLCSSQRGFQVQTLGDEVASGAGTQLHALDVLRHLEIFRFVGAAVVLDAQTEDGQLLFVYCLHKVNMMFTSGKYDSYM